MDLVIANIQLGVHHQESKDLVAGVTLKDGKIRENQEVHQSNCNSRTTAFSSNPLGEFTLQREV